MSDPLLPDPTSGPELPVTNGPSQAEIQDAVSKIRSDMFTGGYSTMYDGTDEWNALEIPSGDLYAWEDASTYIKLPPFFEGITKGHESQPDIAGARVLCVFGDSLTTDHISPAGAIARKSEIAVGG